jgi:hypothetical protein
LDGAKGAEAPAVESASPESEPDDLEALRTILLSQQRARIAELQAELDGLEERLNDPHALAAMIAPALSAAIRVKLRDSRDEMVESLYPIIGQLVVRAVSEAVRDLARSIDARLRQSLDFRSVWQRFAARLRGVSPAELALRSALPFEVRQVFLIHRDTGLLLHHASRAPGEEGDSELIGSMLTAIRDFVHDTFGQGHGGQLDEIQYGDLRILIETAQHTYLAVVVDGVEPTGFRSVMREQIIQVEQDYEPLLTHFDGNAAPFAVVEPAWRGTILPVTMPALPPAQTVGNAHAAG